MIIEKALRIIYENFAPWANVDKKIMKIYRKANKASCRGDKFLAKYYEYKIRKKYNCIISSKAKIGENLKLPHPIGIIIGEGAEIGNDCVIYQNVTLGRKKHDISEYPKIENNVIIYGGTTIVGNVVVGKNSTIGCNSVVLRNIDENTVNVGVIK